MSKLYLPKEVKEFIDAHDTPGEILALFDEDKMFYEWLPWEISGGLCRYLCHTKYLRIRVGGNSFRIGNHLKGIARKYNLQDRIVDIDDYVKSHHFEWDEPLVQYADKYDSRSQGNKSMVWFYVNNVTCGWYKDDGTFQGFNSNTKGAWQIAEVIKAQGYKDIPPATCALTSGKFKDISGRQEAMCKEIGVDFLNMLPYCIDRIK